MRYLPKVSNLLKVVRSCLDRGRYLDTRHVTERQLERSITRLGRKLKMEKKIQRVFVDHGFGFPVKLLNVPMIKVRGNWTPNINYNRLAELILKELCWKSAKLTGNEIKFIRQYFGMTLQAFAKRFYVTHAGVIKWEKNKAASTGMAWATEKDIRLFVLSNLDASPKEIADLYEKLENYPSKTSTELALDVTKMAA